MTKILVIDHRYCCQCQRTTRHIAQGPALVCPLCNSVKLPRIKSHEKNR